MSARTIRVQPSWAKEVAVALPMPEMVCKIRCGYDGGGLELTGGCTGDESDAGEECGRHGL